MLDKLELKRRKPLLLFFITYTVIFYLFAITLKYTFPFLAGFLLALLVQPLIRVLKKHMHCKPGLASILVTFLVFIVMFGLLYLLGYWLIYEITNLISKISDPRITSATSPIGQLLNQVTSYASKIDSNFISQNKDEILNFAKSSMGIISTVLSAVLSFLTSLPTIFTMFIVMIFSTYFFSKDMPTIKKRVMSLFSKNAAVNIRSASHHSVSMSGKYVCSYLLIYFITFIETLIVFVALGVPYPLVISIITGVADVLPVLGPGTIYIPLAVIYLLTGDFFKAIALLVCWLLITVIRQVIEPKIVSSSINIHPLSMLAAIYFSLIAGNIWILLYFSGLFLLYAVLTKSEVLPTIFEKVEPIKPMVKTEEDVAQETNTLE